MTSIRSSITVSLVPEARGGPFVFWDDLPGAARKAAEYGFDAVEVFPPGPEVVEEKGLRALLDDHGLALAAVGTGAGWVKHRLTLSAEDAGTRAKARGFVRSIVEAAGALGAPAIIGSMQGRTGGTVDRATGRAYLAEALDELGEAAARFGVPLLYEPLNRYETDLVNTVEAGLELLGRLSTGNVKLLCDLFHMNIEEADIAAALRLGGDKLGHVHFVDSNRWAAGMGHLDFGPVAEALGAMDYRGYASAEALPLPSPDAAAAKTIETFRKVFGTERSH
ncbi:MAG TPA: sugar phosphate isomerase/epimerase family protein [Isosphaeraceae bacterium]|jgi:sugar phosphate isomerase/epimerase|nr:sugar phosphate isomerase/epimerase family protein [Isosphaeraceae bacterium]